MLFCDAHKMLDDHAFQIQHNVLYVLWVSKYKKIKENKGKNEFIWNKSLTFTYMNITWTHFSQIYVFKCHIEYRIWYCGLYSIWHRKL